MKRVNVRVHLDGQPEPLDVVTDNRDFVAWDLAASQKKWPGADRAPSLFTAFLAWHALRREQRYEADFDRFRAVDCIDLVEAAAEEVDPTRPGPSGG